MKKLTNPRKYLSWTQISMFLQSPDKYYRNYILETEEVFVTKEMRFGGMISDLLEKGGTTGDLVTDMVISKIEKLPLREFTIKEVLKTPNGEVDLLGRLDTFCDKELIIREYKTGKTKWTQGDANKNGQILLYALLVYLKYGKLPKEVWVDWIQTENTEDKSTVRFTGNIVSYKVDIKMSDIINCMATVSKVAVAIDKMYQEHQNGLSRTGTF